MTDETRRPGRDSVPDETPDDKDAAFIERVARPLRAPERLDVTFEARVMSAVNAESRAGHAPGAHRDAAALNWWRTPRTFRLSPAGALARAAAFAGIVLVAAYAVQSLAGGQGRRSSQTRTASGAADTVHLVRFVFLDPAASAVSLVGDFNGWTKGATQLTPTGEQGVWFVSLPLPPGRHEYAFVVQSTGGERWAADPYAALVRDEFDTESSVLVLSGQQRSTS